MDDSVIPLEGEGETLRLGEEIGQRAFPGAVIGLTGPLGAGKTTLVRGIAAGMGIHEGYVVSSPTFSILQNYPCRELSLWHLDLYRIEGPDDLDSTGYRDTVGGDRVLVVEWVEREPEVLPHEHLMVEMEYSGKGEGRVALLRPRGDRYASLVKEVLARLSFNGK